MRVLSLLLIGGLVLLVASPTWAVTIPTLSAGWNALQSRNDENGTVYFPTPPATVADVSPNPFDGDTVPANVTVLTPTAAVLQRDLVGALTGDTPGELEDSWGIFLLYNISPGVLINGGTAVDAIASPTYSNDTGTQDTWIVGVFWGADDKTIALRNPTAGNESDLNVLSSQLSFELWAVDATSLAADHSSNSLTAFNAGLRAAYNRYTGWVDGVSGTKLLTGTSTYFDFDGTVANAGYFSGDSTIYFDIPKTGANVGYWNPILGENQLLTAPDQTTADAYMTWRLQQSTNGWDAKSQDFGGIYAIPEPITMIGLLLGAGGLCRYVRKRR